MAASLVDELVDGGFGEFCSGVFPQEWAVAAGAFAWAVGDVDCQSHFVWKFLENDVCAYEFQHVSDSVGSSCVSFICSLFVAGYFSCVA